MVGVDESRRAGILTLVGVDQLILIYPTLEAAQAGTPSTPASPRHPGDDHSGTAAGYEQQTEHPPTQA